MNWGPPDYPTNEAPAQEKSTIRGSSNCDWRCISSTCSHVFSTNSKLETGKKKDDPSVDKKPANLNPNQVGCGFPHPHHCLCVSLQLSIKHGYRLNPNANEGNLSKGGFRGNSCTLTAGLISPSPVVLTEIFC